MKVREIMKNIQRIINDFKYEMAEEITPEDNTVKTEENAGIEETVIDKEIVEPEENKEPIEEETEEKTPGCPGSWPRSHP